MQTITDNNGTDHVIIQYADSKFEYDITPFGHGYTVQMSSGDEEYFDSVADANYGIKRDIVHILWDNHPTPKGKLWTNDDLDRMIKFITARPDRKEWFFNYVANGTNYRDLNAIKAVINEGYAEYFDRYDSDVAEQFIRKCNFIEQDYYL